MRRITSAVFCVGLAGAAATVGGLSGCVSQNERVTIGDNLPIEAISEPSPTAMNAGEKPAAPAPMDQAPSITGVDRSSWTPMNYVVPVDGVGHRPHYRSDHKILLATARQRLEFPTAETCLELDGRPDRPVLGEEFSEAVSQPVIALGEAVLIVPRLVVEPQSRVVRSPLKSPQRTPVKAVTLPAPVTPTAPAASPEPAQPEPVQASAPSPVAPAAPVAQPAPSPAQATGDAAAPYREVAPSAWPSTGTANGAAPGNAS
jgi:hypothetical protein